MSSAIYPTNFSSIYPINFSSIYPINFSSNPLFQTFNCENLTFLFRTSFVAATQQVLQFKSEYEATGRITEILQPVAQLFNILGCGLSSSWYEDPKKGEREKIISQVKIDLTCCEMQISWEFTPHENLITRSCKLLETHDHASCWKRYR